MSNSTNSVLITGGNGGLGSVVSEQFQQRGWVVLAPNQDELNVLESKNVVSFFSALGGGINAVVHLVGGIVTASDVAEHTDQDYQKMVDLNLTSTFNVIRSAFSAMKSGGGSIVTIGAQSVLHPVAGRALYSASKAAVVSLTQSVAEEGKPYSIRANCIIPSIIKTPSNVEWAENNQEEDWITPEEISQSIIQLSETSCGINGAVIPMFGKIPY